MVNGVAQRGRKAAPRGGWVGALMKQVGAEADGRRSLPSWASRLVSASAVAALALIAAPGAKADVTETLNLMGDFGNFLGPLTSFTGTVDLDFSNHFTMETLKSISISVKGHTFNQNVSLSLLPSVGIIGASDSAGDTLELSFVAPASGTWVGFTEGDVSFGDVAFSGASVLLGATGGVTRVGPPILAPPIIVDPPPIIGPGDPPAATAPELSTWAMMLIGLAGLGLVAKRRRALGLLGGKA
jgi:MYXO-CTERM domain-containing protein